MHNDIKITNPHLYAKKKKPENITFREFRHSERSFPKVLATLVAAGHAGQVDTTTRAALATKREDTKVL